MNFFEKYPEFINEGTTGVEGQRLEYRYKAIIENQRNSFKNAKVLDQNLLISGHNRALLQLACSGNALQRGDMNPIRAIKIIKRY